MFKERSQPYSQGAGVYLRRSSEKTAGLESSYNWHLRQRIAERGSEKPVEQPNRVM